MPEFDQHQDNQEKPGKQLDQATESGRQWQFLRILILRLCLCISGGGIARRQVAVLENPGRSQFRHQRSPRAAARQG